MERTHYVTTDSPMGWTRITVAVAEDVWLDTVYAQLMIDKYLPLVVGTADTDR